MYISRRTLIWTLQRYFYNVNWRKLRYTPIRAHAPADRRRRRDEVLSDLSKQRAELRCLPERVRFKIKWKLSSPVGTREVVGIRAQLISGGCRVGALAF